MKLHTLRLLETGIIMGQRDVQAFCSPACTYFNTGGGGSLNPVGGWKPRPLGRLATTQLNYVTKAARESEIIIIFVRERVRGRNGCAELEGHRLELQVLLLNKTDVGYLLVKFVSDVECILRGWKILFI